MAGGLVKTALNGIKSTVNLGDAVNIIGGVADYKNAREQGNSKAVSVAKAVGSFAFYEMLGPWGFAVMGAQIAGSIAPAMAQHTTQTMHKAYNSRGYLGSGYFEMTQAGYTMRQRSLNAIRQNGLNTQSVLGNEARTYFRGTV